MDAGFPFSDAHKREHSLTSIRVESDSMGTINVPSDKYYGAQTARSLANFDIGGEKMPSEIMARI